MNAFWSALAPSVTSSLSAGASGALEGEMAGEDRNLKNQLTQAQINWQNAHAAGYQQGQKTSMNALRQLQMGMEKDPNFIRSDMGRFLAFTAGHFDPNVQDASAGRYNAQANSSNAHAGLFTDQAETERRIRDEKEAALAALDYQRRMVGDQYRMLTPEKVREVESRTNLNKARGLSETSLQGLRNFQGQLAKQRADLAKAQKENVAKGGGHALNLYSYAEMLHDRINQALEDQANGQGNGPDYNDILLLEDVRMKLRGPEYTPMPLGSPGMGSRATGQVAQPEVPEQKSLFGNPISGTAKPPTPPAMKPLDTTPRKPKTSMRPGAAEQEQSSLWAQKLLKDKGSKFASEQLKTNKRLTPTEKLALQQALEKAMTEASLNE